jgi:hypothetical protein
MKIKVTILLFLVTISVAAQAYYPSFNTLFLNDEDESLFSQDLNYFRNELKVISTKLFLGDIQTSVSQDNSAAFYGFKVLPKIKEYNFLNSGVFLKNQCRQKSKARFFSCHF